MEPCSLNDMLHHEAKSEMWTEARPLQPEKAQYPMLVTLLGMVTEVKPLQPRKVLAAILVTLSGMETEVRPLQSRNILNIDNQIVIR